MSNLIAPVYHLNLTSINDQNTNHLPKTLRLPHTSVAPSKCALDISTPVPVPKQQPQPSSHNVVLIQPLSRKNSTIVKPLPKPQRKIISEENKENIRTNLEMINEGLGNVSIDTELETTEDNYCSEEGGEKNYRLRRVKSNPSSPTNAVAKKIPSLRTYGSDIKIDTLKTLTSKSNPVSEPHPDGSLSEREFQDTKRNLIKVSSKFFKNSKSDLVPRRVKRVGSARKNSIVFKNIVHFPDVENKIDEDILKSLYQKASFDRPVSMIKLKEFWKNLSNSLGINIQFDDKLFENIFKQCELDNTGRIETEHIKLFLSFYSLKLRVSPFTDDILYSSFPRYVPLMKEIYTFINMNYDPEKDKNSLFQFWKSSFPDEDIPQIPSEEWKKIGFQNNDPQTDFRGAGRFGLQCLLALTQHKNLFQSVRTIIEEHDLSFVLASFNVLGLILDYIGWGYKTPQVPYGEKIQTYRGLLELLFDVKLEQVELSTAIKISIRRFHKVYFMCMGLLSKDIKKRGTSYLEFPNTLAATSVEIEEVLTKVNDEISLNKYLFETFNLDPILLFEETYIFYVFLWINDVCEIIKVPNNSQTLDYALRIISLHKNLQYYHPVTLFGEPIKNLEVAVNTIVPCAIYYVLQGSYLPHLSKEDSPVKPVPRMFKDLSRSTSPLTAPFNINRRRRASFLQKSIKNMI